jgi:hypothetical protein
MHGPGELCLCAGHQNQIVPGIGHNCKVVYSLESFNQIYCFTLEITTVFMEEFVCHVACVIHVVLPYQYTN